MSKYPRGSEWRRWDLHFHTPSSSNCYKDKSVTNTDIVEGWAKNGISVVAITDHHVIDITRIKELASLASSRGITVLPGIEFCSDSRGDVPLHFIGIFPEDSDIEYVWGEINSKANIAKQRNDGRSDNQIYCDFKDTCKLIHDLNGLVSVHAGNKTNTIETITNALPTNMAEKIDLASCVDIYEVGKIEDQVGYNEKVFPAIKRKIPMILCSDNHNIKEYNFKSNLWIKADPTFAGLKHILQEPDARIFIGDVPSVVERVNMNKTKYISSISIDTVDGKDDISNIWFKSNHIPLNMELVAVIGNKGSGKSALSDIIGLCADAEHSDNFLFLHSQKFKKKNLADRFCSSIQFASGSKTAPRTLLYNIIPTDAPKVQYLPQHYFETVCNEIGKVDSFKKEIEKVVFQYISDEKKLRKNSFSELLSFKKESIESEIRDLKANIDAINNEIVVLEDKKNPEYIKSIESKIAIKNEELRVHSEQRPSEKQNPETIEESPEEKIQKESLTTWNTKLSENIALVETVEDEVLNTALAIEELNQLKRDIESKVREVEQFVEAKRASAAKFSLDISNIINIKADVSSVSNLISLKETENTQRKDSLGNDNLPENAIYDQLKLKAKVVFCNKEIGLIKVTLSQPEQEYQKYLEELKKWELKRGDIVGSSAQADTLEFFNQEIQYLQNDLENELTLKRATRIGYSKQIFQKKNEIKSFYDDIKSEIDAKLVNCQDQKLTIDSSFSLARDFTDIFMGFVNKTKAGSFRGQEEGKKLFQDQLLRSLDLNSEESINSFLNNVILYFENDKRDSTESQKQTFIGDQISRRSDFYSFLFNLDYLEPHYELRQNGKKLDELSPGEKGALLLVFYLVLDMSEIPLIIDQPEDNLDNHSVAKVLVPFIRNAKTRRQIIMVTHNPNLAVVADAEQIIHVEIDKANGNKFSFSSGSIEDAEINGRIVNVLEGTMPAFTTRKRKYHP